MNTTIRIGVSACLLGENVRYDGQPKACAIVRDVLSLRAVLVPVCPETGVGMPVPREPVDLFGASQSPRMVGVNSGEDWTERVNNWVAETISQLTEDGLHGFVLKARSPSCGVGTAERYLKPGDEPLRSDGLLVLALRRQLPELPIVEDEDLVDENTVNAFVARVLAYQQAGSA